MESKFLHSCTICRQEKTLVNSIATYNNEDPESVPFIGLVKRLKNDNDEKLFSEIREHQVFKIYMKELVGIINDTVNELKKIPVLIFPPTKPNQKNQIKEMIFTVFKGNISTSYIELLANEDFKLKAMGGMTQRAKYLYENHKKWNASYSPGYTEKSENYYIFVDDIILNGVMAKYSFQSLINNGIQICNGFRIFTIGLAFSKDSSHGKRFKPETDILVKI
ncbi:MAG: hypothetical protein KAG14_02840 [Mycoplasmataceae bacterium]|nr:hypothetical protein [Mycoplasmataceae bacterium]